MWTSPAVFGITILLVLSSLLNAQPASEPVAAPTSSSSDRGLSRVVDVSGYWDLRRLPGEDELNPHAYIESAFSLFLSKSLGKWRVQTEFNLHYEPNSDSDGLHLFRYRATGLDMDTAWVNYTARDWLQVQGGFVFVPTYWRTHRYQSTTLTPDDPLIDQAIFPPAILGASVHGDKYWENSGFSYVFYSGVTQENNPDPGTSGTVRAKAVGGKVVFHLPTKHWFETLDIGFHHLREHDPDGTQELTHGLELLVEKGRLAILAEGAYSFVNEAGQPSYRRRGHYIQPSWRLRPKWYLVARRDILEQDSRAHAALGVHSIGLTYRPVPTLSLKSTLDRRESELRGSVYYGASLGIVYFFRLP